MSSKNQIIWLGPEHLEGLSSVLSSRHLVPVLLQAAGKQQAIDAIVVDNQQMTGCALHQALSPFSSLAAA